MGKVSKATKHFSKNHLSNEIKTRKLRQKIKFREAKTWGARKSPEELEAEKKRKNPSSEVEDLEAEVEDAQADVPDEYNGNVDAFLEKGFFDALEEEDEADDANEVDDDQDDSVDPKKHKRDLERLKVEQPEFYKYLAENDASLLEFDDEGDDEEGDEANEKGEDAPGGEEEAEDESKGPKTLTTAMIDTWAKQLVAGESFKGLRDLVRAFESACHIDDMENTKGKDAVKKAAGPEGGRAFKYRIGSGATFERLMRLCVTRAHAFFGRYLGLKDLETTDPRKLNPQTSARWKRLSPVAKAYVRALTGFLETLTDPAMVHLLLRHAERMLPYVRPFPKTARKLLKVALRVFGSVEETRVQGFLLVRRLALEMPYPFIETCFKGMYLTYVRQTKFTNPNVIQGQHFMAQCVVEVFGLDMNVAYEHAFVYIRQLAIQLRAALTSNAQKSAEANQVISSWQYVNSLKLWARMLSAYPGKDQLHALVYPFVQVAMGTVRHLNAPKYAPLRLQICGALTRVGRHAGAYIPLAPVILDILAGRDLHKTSAKPGAGPVDFGATIKLSKAVLETRVYQEGVFEETLKALLLFYGSCCYSPSFPELIVPAVLQLRAFAKATTVSRFRRQVKDLIERLERNAAYISRLRSAGGRSPQDKAPLNSLLPSQGATVGPLDSVYQQCGAMVGGDLKDLLKAHNAKLDEGGRERGGDSDEEGGDEEGGRERSDEPRWKEARREKRRRERAQGRRGGGRDGEGDGDGSSDGGEEVEPAPARGKRRKGGKAAAAAKAADVREVGGEDRVEALAFSSDED